MSRSASMIITTRDPGRFRRAGLELAASVAIDLERFARFFAGFPSPINHLVVGTGPHYTPFAELDAKTARRDVHTQLPLPLQIARNAAGKLQPGATLPLIGETSGRTPVVGPVLTAVAGGVARHDEEPRTRGRSHPHEPDRARLGRHIPFLQRSPAASSPRAAVSSGPSCRSDASSNPADVRPWQSA